MTHRRCFDCDHYAADPGECRRHPPVRLPRQFAPQATAASRERDEHLIWGWPTVGEDDWCGEYEPNNE